MNKRFIKTLAQILGAIILLLILLLAVGPFLIPIAPLENLVSAQMVAVIGPQRNLFSGLFIELSSNISRFYPHLRNAQLSHTLQPSSRLSG